MRKITKRRILSSVLAVAVGLSTIGFSKMNVAVYAEPDVNGSRTSTDSKTWYTQAQYDEYAAGHIDFSNGETVLRSNEKVNVLAEVMDRDESFDILEIVPFEYASQFNVLVPEQSDKELFAKYAPNMISIYNSSKNTNVTELSFTGGNGDISNSIFYTGVSESLLQTNLGVDIKSSEDTALAIASAEKLAMIAALAANPGDVATDIDTVITAIQTALDKVGVSVSAEWDNKETKTVKLTCGDKTSTFQVEVTVIGSSFSPDDILKYIDAYTQVYTLTTTHNIGQTYDEVKTPVNEALNILKSANSDMFSQYSCEVSNTNFDKTSNSVSYTITLKGSGSAEQWSVSNNVTMLRFSGYTAYMESYYLENLFHDLLEDLAAKYGTDSKKYKNILKIKEYFEQDGKLRVHTILASDINGSTTFEYDGDKVDMIYVTQSSTYNQAVVYRNAFLSQNFLSDTTPDDDTIAKFIMNKENLDTLYHTDVYKADGTEYKLSELVNNSNVNYGDLYVKNSSGELKPNDLSWEGVTTILEYIFNSGNDALLGKDIVSGNEKRFRVPVMFELEDENSGLKYDNVYKLYYLICKSTDEPGTYAFDESISTYYDKTDSNYFMNKYSEYINADTPIYANYITQKFTKLLDVSYIKYKGPGSTESYNQPFNNGLSEETLAAVTTAYNNAVSEGNSVYILSKNSYYYLMSLRKDDWNNNFYQIYNGVIGMNTNKNSGRSMMIFKPDSGFSLNDDPAASYRLGDIKDSFYFMNDYLLGLDASDYLLPPEAKFTHAEQDGATTAYADRIGSSKRIQLYPDPTFVESITDPADPNYYDVPHGSYYVNYQDVMYNLVDDTDKGEIKIYFYGEIIGADAGSIYFDDCELHTIISGVDTTLDRGDYSLTKTTVTSDGSITRVDGYYVLDRTSEAYTAFLSRQLELKFVLPTIMEMDLIKYQVKATTTLKFLQRDVHQLD
ncbi:MAG: hypothetical protein ACI4EU_00540 [Butyrivibrio sp.]